MSFIFPASVVAVLEKSPSAFLTTINQDGSPQSSLVVPLFRDDEIVISHMSNYLKLRNIRRDGRVLFSVQTDVRNEQGAVEYFVVHGTAHVTEGGAVEVVNEAVRRATGDPDATIFTGPPELGFLTHIVPERIVGVGPWSEQN